MLKIVSRRQSVRISLSCRDTFLREADVFTLREVSTCVVMDGMQWMEWIVFKRVEIVQFRAFLLICCQKMAHRLPYLLGMIFTVLSFILCAVGFGTGSWWVTTDEESVFHNAGLWQICFNGYEHTSDLIGKAYYGCWWIFYREYYYIRDWIMPRMLDLLECFKELANLPYCFGMSIIAIASRSNVK